MNLNSNLSDGVYNISYTEIDSAWNTSSSSPNLRVTIDTNPPVLTLLWSDPQSINRWDSYTELWATANDAEDWDITWNIVIDSSSVNTNLVGSYTVNYNVSDDAWNSVSQTRVVNVVWNPSWWSWWGWWGWWSSGWSSNSDDCPNWDLSPSPFDWKCEKVEDDRVKVWWEESNKDEEESNEGEDEDESNEDEDEYNEEEIEVKLNSAKKEDSKKIKEVEINGEIRKYRVNKKTCEIMRNILDDNYRKDYKTEFRDILWLDKISVENIIRLEKTGIVKWRKKWYFVPESKITRAEFLSIALQSHCYDVYKPATWLPFKDMQWDLSDWKARVVQVWYDNEIITWYYDNTFRPNDNISRIEAYAILMKLQKIELLDREKENSLKDSYIDKKDIWQRKPLSLWEYLWILNPIITKYKFFPDKKIKRGETVDLMIKIMKMY